LGNISLCPFAICPAKFDPNDKVMAALVGNSATKNLTLDTLLDMYKSKYSFPKYLPHKDMMNFVEQGKVFCSYSVFISIFKIEF
jgi:hypothetical protein